jgi:4-amino-4-deoxy-L-arabinose transferase-like glycosyltransferase
MSETINEMILLFVRISFITFILLFIYNWNFLKKKFLKIDTKYWLFLLAIFIIALGLRVFLPNHAHMMWTDESQYMLTGKNILQDSSIDNYSRSIGWPFLLSILFGVFGLNNWVALYTAVILGSLTVINIFLMGFYISKRKDIALISALIFSLFWNHILWSSSAETNVISLFFITLTIALSFIYYRSNELSLGYLAIASIGFTAQIRPENYYLFPLFILGIFLYKKKMSASIFTILLLVFLLTCPNLYNNIQTHTQTNFLEIESNGEIKGSNFSINNLVHNSIHYGKYIFDSTFQPITFSVLLVLGGGFVFFFSKKEFYFLFTWFMFLWGIYFMSWFQTFGCTYDLSAKTRFFIMYYPITTILASYGVIFLKENINKFSKNKIFLTIILLFLVANFVPFFQVQDCNSLQCLQTDIPERAERDIPSNCTVVTVFPEVLTSTTNIKVVSAQDYLLKDTNYDLEECLLFYEDGVCQLGSIDDTSPCEIIMNDYYTEEYITYSNKLNHLTFYKINGKKQ